MSVFKSLPVGPQRTLNNDLWTANLLIVLKHPKRNNGDHNHDGGDCGGIHCGTINVTLRPQLSINCRHTSLPAAKCPTRLTIYMQCDNAETCISESRTQVFFSTDHSSQVLTAARRAVTGLRLLLRMYSLVSWATRNGYSCHNGLVKGHLRMNVDIATAS
ncbi:hypothetical protein BDR05DRAFT_89689 [Suillus weaverae]|nr:hypothetical protein BDR05DRAFT_89689 [Suillus weaverae]